LNVQRHQVTQATWACDLNKLSSEAGVMLMDLTPNTVHQGILSDAPEMRENSMQVMAAFDALNQCFGRDMARLGSTHLAPRWAMRAENKTPRYTTRSDELPKAHAN
jgi:DNA polymerase V